MNETMNNETQERNHSNFGVGASILLSAIILAGAWIYTTGSTTSAVPHGSNRAAPSGRAQGTELEEKVLPSAGVVVPVTWGDLGAQLVHAGVIDADKLMAIYGARGAFTDAYKNLLLGQNDGKLRITRGNAGYVLNLFWALGLGNKNSILENGEMTDPAYGGAGNFASTGGWTIAKGNSMDHYSKHSFLTLTPDQQALVDKVSRGIYRPCCGNATHFPDCNHGMAMLGLLELMASQGVNERDMVKAALAANAYWFPDTYLTIATYMSNKGVDWKNADPREILGINYSSAQGYQRIAAQVVQPQERQGGGGCDINAGGPSPRQSGFGHAGGPAAPQRQQNRCGI